MHRIGLPWHGTVRMWQPWVCFHRHVWYAADTRSPAAPHCGRARGAATPAASLACAAWTAQLLLFALTHCGLLLCSATTKDMMRRGKRRSAAAGWDGARAELALGHLGDICCRGYRRRARVEAQALAALAEETSSVAAQ